MITIILAGGNSSRMRQNKALMKINGERVIDRLVAEFDEISEEIFLIAKDVAPYENLSVNILQDDVNYRGQGPLAGFWTAMSMIKTGPCLVVACDMPFATKELGQALIHKLIESKGDAVMPVVNGQQHPLFAAYDATIADKVKLNLDKGKRSVHSLLDTIEVNYFQLPTDAHDVWNMNTQEDYIQALKIVEGKE